MINLRHATLSDAEELVRVHHAAVHGPEPSTFYTQNVLQSWASSPTDEYRVNQLRQAIENRKELIVVVESAKTAGIVGFGSIIPSQKELRAVYVHPALGCQGVGSKILSNLEELALLHGVDKLNVDASLNAERFYSRHGYSVVERAGHQLSSGIIMDCVKMGKELHTHQ